MANPSPQRAYREGDRRWSRDPLTPMALTATKGSLWLTVVLLFLACAIFITNLLTPLGTSVWLLYAVLVVVSLWLPYRASAFALAAVCTLLMILNFLYAPPHSPPPTDPVHTASVNLALGLIMLWGIAALTLPRRRAEKRLRESAEQLRALAGRLESIREEERARIARELHDELGQMLTGLHIDLAWLTRRASLAEDARIRAQLQEKLAESLGLVETTLKAARRLATELRPPILDALGLVPAIKSLTQEVYQHSGLTCRYTGEVERVHLRPDRATAVFRVVQEALTNVTRHAQATLATVMATVDTDRLTVQVHDNGRGISEEDLSKPRSLGLLGMQERARLVGGELHVAGVPGRGTTVTLTVPLEQPAERIGAASQAEEKEHADDQTAHRG